MDHSEAKKRHKEMVKAALRYLEEHIPGRYNNRYLEELQGKCNHYTHEQLKEVMSAFMEGLNSVAAINNIELEGWYQELESIGPTI
jgi:hypothetical protein